VVLVATDVHKEYGHRQVLSAVSVGINPGDRIALVGANGAGKSTLIRILAGVEAPDDGRISHSKHDELGYLPQSMPMLPGATIEEVIATSVAGLRQMELRMRQLEELMGSTDGTAPDVLDEYGEISHHFESRGGYELQAAIGQVLAGLGVGHLAHDRPVSRLSGGEKARVGLAALLLVAPDILLLDEPTNDLDEQALRWLQAYLPSYRGGILLISQGRVLVHFHMAVIPGFFAFPVGTAGRR
jgi:macrolide transport system ATP-binding/permease protein